MEHWAHYKKNAYDRRNPHITGAGWSNFQSGITAAETGIGGKIKTNFICEITVPENTEYYRQVWGKQYRK